MQIVIILTVMRLVHEIGNGGKLKKVMRKITNLLL